MVRDDSPLQRTEDLDRPGVRMSVATNSAHDLLEAHPLRRRTHSRVEQEARALGACVAGR